MKVRYPAKVKKNRKSRQRSRMCHDPLWEAECRKRKIAVEPTVDEQINEADLCRPKN